VEEIRAGQRWFGHAPVGAGTSTKAPNVSFIPWTAGSRIDPIVGWMGISRQQ
jgi:hypothetical protein